MWVVVRCPNQKMFVSAPCNEQVKIQNIRNEKQIFDKVLIDREKKRTKLAKNFRIICILGLPQIWQDSAFCKVYLDLYYAFQIHVLLMASVYTFCCKPIEAQVCDETKKKDKYFEHRRSKYLLRKICQLLKCWWWNFEESWANVIETDLECKWSYAYKSYLGKWFGWGKQRGRREMGEMTGECVYGDGVGRWQRK